MQKFLIVVVFLTLLAFPLMAQDDPKIELFGGYQYLRANNFDGLGDGANSMGWNTSVSVNFIKYLGVTADFGGSYEVGNVLHPDLSLSEGSSVQAHAHIYTYTLGPVVSFNAGEKVRVFGHGLFGGAHVWPTACVIYSGSPDECGSGGQNGFAMMFGGGVDLKAGKLIAYRLAQFDWVYLPSQFGAQSGNLRFSTGMVFRF